MSAVGVPVFTPIPPGFDVKQLTELPNSRFHLATRVDARTITPHTAGAFDNLYRTVVFKNREPLVIDNWHQKGRWPGHIFKNEWLDNNMGKQRVQVRDLVKGTDDEWSLGWYLSKCSTLASKFTPESYKSPKRQRLYLKDMDCPTVWMKNLGDILPNETFYLDEHADLMSALPEELRAVNMMCYVGHEGTFTPCHKEMCSSIGQNIMVSASENGKSIWFLVKPDDRAKLASWFRSELGQDLELENYFASVEDWKKAPVDVWIVEQEVGDFLIIPPASPHQVWNQGDLTVKAAWNRCTPESLRVCLSGELSMSKFACREEAYKVKTMVYMAMLKIAIELGEPSPYEDEGLVRDFLILYTLFEAIMLDESFSPELPVPTVEDTQAEYGITCSFCSGNIFNRFLSCSSCPLGEGDNIDYYDICMDCYTLGRRCKCGEPPKWVQQYPWATLQNDHERFRQIFNRLVGDERFDSIFVIAGVDRAARESLEHLTGLENVTRKSRAWVSQELSERYAKYPGQRRGAPRVIKDVTTKHGEEDSGGNCHVCKNPHSPILYVECSNARCTKRYCWGYIWRAFSQNPYMILSSLKWKCPYCLKQCTCAACIKSGRNSKRARRENPVWLGYNTRAVADPRSEEWLTTFSKNNKKWATLASDGGSISQKRKRSDGSDEDSDADVDGTSGSSGDKAHDHEGSVLDGDGDADDGSNGGWEEGHGKHPGLLEFPSAFEVRGGEPSFISGKRSSNVNLLASQLAILARKCELSTGDTDVRGGGDINVTGRRGQNSLAIFDNHSLENTIASPKYPGLDSSALGPNDLSQLEMDPEAFRIAAGLLPVEDNMSTPFMQQRLTVSPEELSLPLLLSAPVRLEVERVVKSPTPEPIETKAGWVKKAKLARKRFANLQAGKNRRKSLIVKLKVSVPEWEEEPVCSDLPPKKVIPPSEEAAEKEDEVLSVQPLSPSPQYQGDGGPVSEDDGHEESAEDIPSDGPPHHRRKAAPRDGEYISRNRTGNPPAPLMALSSMRSRRRSHSLQGSNSVNNYNSANNSSKHTPSLEQPLTPAAAATPAPVLPSPPPPVAPLTSLIPEDWPFAVIITENPDRSKYPKTTSTGRPRGRPRKVQPISKGRAEDRDFRLASWSKVMKTEKDTTPTVAKGSVRSRVAREEDDVVVESSEDDDEEGYYVERRPRPVSVDSGEEGDGVGVRVTVGSAQGKGSAKGKGKGSGKGKERGGRKQRVVKGDGLGQEEEEIVGGAGFVGGNYDEEDEYNRRWSRRRGLFQ